MKKKKLHQPPAEMKKGKKEISFCGGDGPSLIPLKLYYTKNRIPLSAEEWDLLDDALWGKPVSVNDCQRIFEKARTEEERIALKRFFRTLEFLEDETNPWKP